MKFFYKVKSVIKAFYEKYDRYVDGVARGLFALLVFLTIMYNTGFNATVTNPFLALGLAVISAFLPVYVITIFAGALLIIEFMSVSLEVAVILLIVLLLMLLLYFVFKASDTWILLLTMTLCLWNIAPALLPIALLFTPIEVMVVAFGTFLYGFVSVVMKDVTALATLTTKLTMSGRINLLLSDIVSNEKLLLMLITLCASMLLITLIKRSRLNDAPFIAIVAGDFLFLVVWLLGNYFLGIPFTAEMIWGLIIGILLNAGLTFIIINFILSMDYKRTENVQFEDDAYYYYVKAIPKSTISLRDKKVHKITDAEDEEPGGKKTFFIHRGDG